MHSIATRFVRGSIATGGNTHIVAERTRRPSSGGGEMIRTRKLSVVATLVVLLCGACTKAEDTPGDVPSPSKPVAPTSASATPSVPPFLVKYSAAERLAYSEAVAAYAKYYARNAEIVASGKLTPSAGRFYRRHAIDWAEAWSNLSVLANNQIRVIGQAKVLSERPLVACRC